MLMPIEFKLHVTTKPLDSQYYLFSVLGRICSTEQVILTYPRERSSFFELLFPYSETDKKYLCLVAYVPSFDHKFDIALPLANFEMDFHGKGLHLINAEFVDGSLSLFDREVVERMKQACAEIHDEYVAKPARLAYESLWGGPEIANYRPGMSVGASEYVAESFFTAITRELSQTELTQQLTV